METIKEIQAGIIEDFEIFDDWIQKYEYLIELGKELAPIADIQPPQINDLGKKLIGY